METKTVKTTVKEKNDTIEERLLISH